jgi:hypothetical protein
MNLIQSLITMVGWLVMLALGAAAGVGVAYLALAFARWMFA